MTDTFYTYKNYNLGRFLSNSFLIGVIVFGLVLTYATMKAKQVADNWEQENNRAVLIMEGIN